MQWKLDSANNLLLPLYSEYIKYLFCREKKLNIQSDESLVKDCLR